MLSKIRPMKFETKSVSDEDLLKLLVSGAKEYRCGQYIYNLDSMERQRIYQELETERLQDKVDRVMRYFDGADKRWNELLFVHLMHSISDPKNVDCYVEIATRIGYATIQRERGSLKDIEALLIAMSGLLPLLPRDNYTVDMAKRGEHLMRKYNLTPLTIRHWNRSNLIAVKHPIIRLSQVARLLFDHDLILNDLLNCATRDDVIALFSVGATNELCRYFGKRECRIGITRCDLLGINLVVPVAMAYGINNSDPVILDRANDLNEAIPPEDNIYLKKWREKGLAPTLSYETQALIQLAKKYCAPTRCQECVIYDHMRSQSSILHRMPTFLE